VLTATAIHPTPAAEFTVRAAAWSLGLFGVLRLSWIDAQLVVPVTGAQGALATALFGAAAAPVQVTPACSGADALALCVGAVLAYPASWRSRLTGAAGGVALILGLNSLRIGTLGRAAATPAWFDVLHLYVWPAVLTLAIAAYVFGWMSAADRRQTPPAGEPVSRAVSLAWRPKPTRRFVALAAVFLVLFSAGSPLYLSSAGILVVAGFIARAAAAILAVFNITAHAADNVLWTARGGFLVTQECISTPLIPVYLAAVVSYSTTWRRMVLAVLATAPLFIALGIARLLVVALPDALGSPLFFVHAFYQLLLGAALVLLAALWRHGRRGALGYALAGLGVGVGFILVLGPVYTRAITFPGGVPLDDPQGAAALLPAFQIGLYLALCAAACIAIGWPRFLAGFAMLGVTQTAGFLALHALASHAGWAVHVRDIRGWAVAAPVLVFVAVVTHHARTRC
jgi:exosortase/archaeosortase family protein